MAYTEFYIRSGGSALNAGSTNTDAAFASYTNGSWDNTTKVFTVASGNPSSDGVTVGMFASVHTNAATFTGYIARITAVTSTTITVSTTADGGSAVSTGALTRNLRVGGAWAPPTGAIDVPYNIVDLNTTNTSGDTPRVNIAAGTYSITAVIARSLDGPTIFEPYSVTPGDGLGRVHYQGPATGSSFQMFAITGEDSTFLRHDVSQNGNAGTANVGFSVQAANNILINCRAFSVRTTGFQITSAADHCTFYECEAYDCNQSNTANHGGFTTAAIEGHFVRCISHDNATANAMGFHITDGSSFIQCIADSNGSHGFNIDCASTMLMNCDSYNNGGDGIIMEFTVPTSVVIESCNLVANGGWGININTAASDLRNGIISNCGFGSGTMANGDGEIGNDTTSTFNHLLIRGSITYSANTTPWADPDDGDFSITSSEAKNIQQSFLQLQSGYGSPNPTVSYTDIGAGQSECTGGGGSEHSFAY